MVVEAFSISAPIICAILAIAAGEVIAATASAADSATRPNDQPPKASFDQGPLFGDDIAAIESYLQTHRIPDIMEGDNGLPGDHFRPYLDQVARARRLFDTNDHGLRLAIARALYNYERCENWYGAWKECGDDDHLAKLYLTGFALEGGDVQQRQGVLDWLFQQQNDPHISAILKNLRYMIRHDLDQNRTQRLCDLLLNWSDNKDPTEGWDLWRLRNSRLDVPPRAGIEAVIILSDIPMGAEWYQKAFAKVSIWATKPEMNYLKEMVARP